MRVAAILTMVALPAPAEELPAGTYRLDPSHASLIFTVDHLGFSDYTAGFDRFDATLQIDPANPASASLSAEIDVTSLDLPAPPEGFLEEMLSTNWFDAGNHPAITFTADAISLTGQDTADLTGTLTLRGVSHPVTLTAAFNGGYRGHPMDPNARIGFSATGQLSRTAFGMGFGVPPEGSTMGVGDEVRFTIEAEFTGPPLEE